jgi:hypothetical protein
MRFAVRVPALHTTPQTRSRMHMLARSSPSTQGFRPRSSQSVGMAPRTTSCTVAAARRRARLEAATQRAVAACPATSGAAREQRQAGGRWWKACALAGATPPSKSSCKLMIAHLSALSADHEEIVEVPSSSRRTEGLPPGHRGDQGEQPLHPRGGGGTPSPLVGWAGGRWPVGAQSLFCTFSPELLQLQVPDSRLKLHSDEQLVAVQVKFGTCSCNRCREKVHNGLGPSGSHWGKSAPEILRGQKPFTHRGSTGNTV